MEKQLKEDLIGFGLFAVLAIVIMFANVIVMHM